jgi:hypothetical protein
VDAEAAEAAAAGGVAGTLPDTAGLQALTGAMDKLEALLRSRETQSNPAGTSHRRYPLMLFQFRPCGITSFSVDVGHKHGANNKDLSAKIKRAKDLLESDTGMLNKGLPAAATSRRQEPWCRLISQYSVVRLVLKPVYYNHCLFRMIPQLLRCLS